MNRKIITKISAAAIAALAVIVCLTAVSATKAPDGSSQEAIVDFLRENGYTVSSPVTKNITIPAEFSEVYENYNRLQKEQGFDLSDYKGEEAVSYTFTVIGCTDENTVPEETVQAHIIVCDGKIIAADVADTRLDGEMQGVISK